MPRVESRARRGVDLGLLLRLLGPDHVFHRVTGGLDRGLEGDEGLLDLGAVHSRLGGWWS